MSEEVKFTRGNDRISHVTDRTYAMGLAALRQAAELTQVELATRLASGRMEVLEPNGRDAPGLLTSISRSSILGLGAFRKHAIPGHRYPKADF
jgi:hypothetical protein